MPVLPFKEYRCTSCKKLMFKGILVESVVEVRCKGCHAMNTIQSSTMDKLLCGVFPCPHRVPVTAPKK